MALVDDREAYSLTSCVAHVLGVSFSEVPEDRGVCLRQWLAGRNLGFVPIEAANRFSWPGYFLGRRRHSRTWATYFGVPPGIVFEPVRIDGPEELDAGFVLAPPDLLRAIGPSTQTATPGIVELIAIAPEAETPMTVVHSAEAIEHRGLEGDRYARGEGTFSDPHGRGYDLTLVESEALEELAAQGVNLEPAGARRNIVVRGVALDELIGKRFRVGGVECFGQRRCEPCAHLERLTKPGVLRGLVHRGGLRADVLSSGEIKTGDPIEALP
ncbi:MAG: MOSC domain-containing protein [Rubrobacteraceae bacterium]